MSADAAVTKPRIRMITPVWGAAYIERWLNIAFAALRADGNVFYLNEHADFELALLTKTEDAERLGYDRRFKQLTRNLRVKFISIDELLPPRGSVHYGVPLAVAYGKAIADLGDAGLGTYVILMNADFVLAAGSLKSIFDRIQQGYGIIAGPSIRAVDTSARPILLNWIDKDTGILSVPPRQMMRLVLDNLHNVILGRTLNEQHVVEANYYHQLYWRISPDCLVARCFLIQPFCFRVDRKMEKVLCPLDYGFATETCPEGRFCVLNDSDEFSMLELQDRDSESYLLRFVPHPGPWQERLTRLPEEIAAHAAEWTTVEHRRAASRNLYFHASDLPNDVDQQAAPLAEVMSQAFNAMPPAVSHLRHIHWLPAVRNYRYGMARYGGDPNCALLDDPRNSLVPQFAELFSHSKWSGNWLRRLVRYFVGQGMVPYGRFRYLLSSLLCAPRVAARRLQHGIEDKQLEYPRAILDKAIKAHVKDSEQTIRVYVGPIEREMLTDADPTVAKLPYTAENFRLNLPPDETPGRGGTAVVYAPLDALSTWSNLPRDADAVLAHRDRLLVAFMTPYFNPRSFAHCSWVLSALLTIFVSTTAEVTIETINAPRNRLSLTLLTPHFLMRLPISLPRRIGRLFKSAVQRALDYRYLDAGNKPLQFSVLLLEFKRRGGGVTS